MSCANYLSQKAQAECLGLGPSKMKAFGTGDLESELQDLTKGKNPGVISRKVTIVQDAQSEHLRKQIATCDNNLAECAFTADMVARDPETGYLITDTNKNAKKGETRNMHVQQYWSNVGSNEDQVFLRRGNDFPAGTTLGELRGNSAYNKFLITQQHYTTQCDRFGNACGGVDRNGKTNKNVPKNVVDSIGNLDKSPSWQRGYKARKGPKAKGGLSGHTYRARNDLKTRGHDDPNIRPGTDKGNSIQFDPAKTFDPRGI